jgi:hypothetical protein
VDSATLSFNFDEPAVETLHVLPLPAHASITERVLGEMGFQKTGEGAFARSAGRPAPPVTEATHAAVKHARIGEQINLEGAIRGFAQLAKSLGYDLTGEMIAGSGVRVWSRADTIRLKNRVLGLPASMRPLGDLEEWGYAAAQLLDFAKTDPILNPPTGESEVPGD